MTSQLPKFVVNHIFPRDIAYKKIDEYYSSMKKSNDSLSQKTKDTIYEYYLRYGTKSTRLASRDDFIYEMMASRCGARSVITGDAYTELNNKIGACYDNFKSF